VTVLKSFGTDTAPGRPLFSPDGRFVTYAFPVDQKGNLDIFVLSVAGGQVTPLVQHPAQEHLLGWTPDGKSVLFLSDRTGNWAAWLVPVADGKPQGEPILVKRDAGAMVPMGFTREGSFYYKIRVDGLNVYTAALDGGEPSLLVERHLGWNFQPEWSPDGKKVAYLSRRQRGSAEATLCIRSVQTGEEREYSDKLKRVSKWPLRWSPDGGSLLIRGGDLQGNSGLFTIDIETEEVARVPWWPTRPYGSYMVEPCWSADGKAVYYVEPSMAIREGRTRLMRTDLATARHEVIHTFPETVTAGAVLLSPDGRWFLFWLIRGAGWSAAVMPIGGTEVRDLPKPWTDVNSRTLTWAPDSGQILFVKRPGAAAKVTRSELWGVPVEGGEQRSLGFSVMRDVRSLSIHPDRKRLVFTAWEPATEVWVMENFLPEPAAAQRQDR
jgi:Tol biopolymer transport system component